MTLTTGNLENIKTSSIVHDIRGNYPECSKQFENIAQNEDFLVDTFVWSLSLYL